MTNNFSQEFFRHEISMCKFVFTVLPFFQLIRGVKHAQFHINIYIRAQINTHIKYLHHISMTCDKKEFSHDYLYLLCEKFLKNDKSLSKYFKSYILC